MLVVVVIAGCFLHHIPLILNVNEQLSNFDSLILCVCEQKIGAEHEALVHSKAVERCELFQIIVPGL